MTLSVRITSDPDVLGGRRCIRGLRIRVTDVLDMLAGGATPAEILDDFPDLEAEDIKAALGIGRRGAKIWRPREAAPTPVTLKRDRASPRGGRARYPSAPSTVRIAKA